MDSPFSSSSPPTTTGPSPLIFFFFFYLLLFSFFLHHAREPKEARWRSGASPNSLCEARRRGRPHTHTHTFLFVCVCVAVFGSCRADGWRWVLEGWGGAGLVAAFLFIILSPSRLLFFMFLCRFTLTTAFVPPPPPPPSSRSSPPPHARAASCAAHIKSSQCASMCVCVFAVTPLQTHTRPQCNAKASRS